MMSSKTLKIAMLGCGVVGSQVARLLIANKADLSTRAGANLELVKVAVRNPKSKNYGVPDELLTSDLKSIVLFLLRVQRRHHLQLKHHT